ncbi:MAG: hypothetical protein M1827_002785 [Pycnora praestabilis]|nr:MAG: hypothetical protein M1827_002785 [Pycnora praestabilis]
MTYTSPFVDIVIRCARIPWYVLGWRNEAETLDITMMEGIEFQRGRSNVPTSLRLEVQSHERMQVYDAKVRFVARFWGLRWMMYNHRIISLLVFTTGFWAVELSFTFLAWLLLSSYFSSPRKETKEIKRDLETDSQVFKTEEDTDALFTEGLSDTERTFPTFSRQPPLRYNNSKIKDEEKEERASGMINTIPPVAEADDEDDELVDIRVGRGGRTDSGLGTSMEESGGRRDDIRRRRAKLFGGNTGGA